MGRIVHDYGYYVPGSYSVNAAHANTSVKYDSMRKRVLTVDKVIFYIKADLQSGFRQFGTHPSDWRFQVYCNGLSEHYIDLACPFGKTNSTLEFCPPVKLFAISAAVRWKKSTRAVLPALSSYVDDVYGGIPGCNSFELSMDLRNYICTMGKQLTFVFNEKPHKTPLPARQQVILGSLYDSTSKLLRVAPAKVEKYVSRIDDALRDISMPAHKIMSLHGNLNFAATAAPFGRPFLSSLSGLVAGRTKNDVVTLNDTAAMCLRIWKKLLLRNCGISYDFILGRLPRTTFNIFVDASEEWGIGGLCGNLYFKFPWSQLPDFVHEFISRKELLSALIALHCFHQVIEDKLTYLYTDNTNVRDWLVMGRSKKMKGLRYLALWELAKFKHRCKVSPRWLPSNHNGSADKLSRGTTPEWLQRDGTRVSCDLRRLAHDLNHVEEAWDV